MAEAKAKVKQKAHEKEAEAIAEFEKKTLVPVKANDEAVRHKDSVPTNEVLNIMADTIEEVFAENGRRVDRLNAREFYAMNIWRHLHLTHKISAREASMTAVYCKEHE